MWTPVFLTAALALGQPAVDLPDVAPVSPPPVRAAVAAEPAAPAVQSAPGYVPPTWTLGAVVEPPPEPNPARPVEAPISITAPLLPTPVPPATPTAAAPPAAAPPARWFLMKELQGTFLGSELDGNRIAVYGWLEGSATASTSAVSNEPMAWNDRANRFLLQQAFFRVERPVVTTGTTMPTFGFRSDWIVGTDYRFTLPRGIWNDQLINSTATQNLYGVDPVEFYGEAYIPNVQQGLDIKVGRFYAPFGEESIEAVSTPLVSRSYTFNSGPEFTNTGVLATLTVDPVWTVCGGYVIGNDNFFDAGDEGRFLGYVKWTQPSGGRNTVTLATTLGRGKFNENAPFAAPEFAAGDTITVSNIGGEVFGRNNINVVDLLYTHTFNPVLSFASETLYGWETNIPDSSGLLVSRTGLPGDGTAHWLSMANYFIYTLSSRTTATARFEFFDDYEGFRTGFKGIYTEVTGGLAVKLRPGLIVRPELRWDENEQARPFNQGGDPSHDQFTAACDVIVRW